MELALEFWSLPFQFLSNASANLPVFGTWKDVSSLDLLARARAIVGERGLAVRNLDVVIIAEQPKLGPYLDAMRAKVAEAAGVAPADVGIKGKTNEGIGPLGHGEAIAVYAVAQLGPQAAGNREVDGPRE